MRVRVGLVTAGAVLIAYAIVGTLTADPIGILVFLIAVLVAHDALWMPAVLLVVAVARTRRKKSERSRDSGAGPRGG
ncbi:hypothetical protein [Paractinoplanes durhamensis]|uniref:Uncharacterized protein n=1 Tax=Paractinoplanes durhamensis TaxID=113563 RepID=A0ABQ3ZAW7_9ACTN|nr:hypothetical protein [Actinoplanes durhamensis]GIE06954.1 hypothetical protein Adu01nite_83040 [Actinoplanes durhamensis]